MHATHLLRGRSFLEAGFRGPSQAILATVAGPGGRVMGREREEGDM